MFKLKEFHNDKKDFGFAVQVMNPWDDCFGKGPHCLYNIKLGKYSWWWDGPELFKPKTKWVDLSKEPWATVGKDGKKGYIEEIQKNYGFSFVEGSGVHVHYGIQPGSWIKDDPENSDHVKVFNFFWNWHHVRHDAYDIDGDYLCCGEHFRFWERHGVERTYDKYEFEDIPDFAYPKDNNWINIGANRIRSDYDNFSDKTLPGKLVYKFYDYIDSYQPAPVRARVNIEERQWVRGNWAWLRVILRFVPGCNKSQQFINVKFKSAVGAEKNSWKGGTVGCSFNMKEDETIDQCWDRFQKEWK